MVHGKLDPAATSVSEVMTKDPECVSPDMSVLDAMRTVAKGGSYLSPQVSDRLLSRIQRGDMDAKPAASALEALSPREMQVLRLVAEGKTSKEIAVILDLGLQTVRSYRKTMMKKLGVNNVASLTQLALAAGVTHFPTPTNQA